MINSSLLKNLSIDSLLTIIPDLPEVIFERGKIESYAKSTIIAEHNKLLTGLYIPIDNDLTLTSTTDKFFLLKGRSLALRNLLFNIPLGYDVKAEFDTKVLYLESSIFLEHLNKYPSHKKYLQFYTSSLAVRNFKHFLEQFEINDEKLRTVFSEIQTLEFKSIEELRAKSKNHVIFINQGKIVLEYFNLQNKIGSPLTEGIWFGTEAISPPHTLSYQIIEEENLSLYCLNLKYLEQLNLNKDAIQKIEDEPCLKLNIQEDDQYLNDGECGSELGIILHKDEIEKLFHTTEINFNKFHLAKSVFSSYLSTIRNFCFLKNVDINIANCHATIRRHIPNLSLTAVLEVLNDANLVGRGVKPENGIDYLNLPLMFIYQTRLLLLILENNNNYYGLDPVHGFFKITKDELLKQDNLEFIEATKPHEASIDDQEKIHLKDEKNVLTSWEQAKVFFQQRKSLWVKIVVTSILIFLINILPPFISQEIIDDVLATKDINTLSTYGGGLLLCYFFIALLVFYRGRITSEFAYLFDFDFSAHFYHKLLKLKPTFFKNNRVGEVLARLTELMRIRSFFSGETVTTIINLISATIYGLILLYYSWKVAIIPFIAISIIAVVQYFAKKRIREKYLQHFITEKKTNSQLSEMINSISTVKAFMSERSLLNNYEDSFLEAVKLRRDLQLLSSAMNVLVSLFSHAVKITAIWVGVLLIFKKELSIGELFSISMFINRILSPLNSLIEFITNLEEVKVSLRKLDDVLGFNFNNEQDLAMMGSKIKGRIHLDRISFKYDEESPEILNDINLSIYPKQVVAIVGESGCGKTTLANLIAGNLSPTKGKIYFDGVDQKFISPTSLKSQIGFIQQNNDLFAGTIESNVTYNHTYTNEGKLNLVLQDANCQEFIERFPTGIKQFLAEGGLGLSGGQKQRLSIARTLYQNPKVLILDEATSALDSESESVLIDNIKKLSIDKTTVLIAHRLSTIRHADRVFVMDEGKIVETGNHHELVQKRGKYYELFKEQMR